MISSIKSDILKVFALCVFISCAQPLTGQQPDSDFDIMVKKLSRNPDDLLMGDKLRRLCRERKENGRCIDALNDLVKLHKNNRNIRYQAALAYVDEVPGHTLFRKGWLSSRSMDLVSATIDQDPSDWASWYIRGLNGIYWPVSFRRLPKAIADLTQCTNLSEKLPAGLLRPYHAFAYIALGDAYAKSGDLEKARAVYQKASLIFDVDAFTERLAMDDKQLTEYIKRIRDSDTPVDTDISFLVTGGADQL